VGPAGIQGLALALRPIQHFIIAVKVLIDAAEMIREAADGAVRKEFGYRKIAADELLQAGMHLRQR